MDHKEEWSGCSYIQLKEMSQDREPWKRKTIEWSSAVANRHRRWSTSDSDRDNISWLIPTMMNRLCRITWDLRQKNLTASINIDTSSSWINATVLYFKQ